MDWRGAGELLALLVAAAATCRLLAWLSTWAAIPGSEAEE
jgi:hypothetical protein